MRVKNLFIDAGSNIGQGFEHFQNLYALRQWDYYLIEPNSHCIKVLEQKYGHLQDASVVNIFNNALYIDESTLGLIGETIGGSRNEGNSIILEHNSGYGTENSQPPARDDGPRRVLMETKCIDVKKLLTDASKKYEKIVMKLDIESSEYDVLERMMDTETYKFVSEIWVEWHSQYMVEFNLQCGEGGRKIRGVYEEREKKIKKFFSDTNVKLNDWH